MSNVALIVVIPVLVAVFAFLMRKNKAQKPVPKCDKCPDRKRLSRIEKAVSMQKEALRIFNILDSLRYYEIRDGYEKLTKLNNFLFFAEFNHSLLKDKRMTFAAELRNAAVNLNEMASVFENCGKPEQGREEAV